MEICWSIHSGGVLSASHTKTISNTYSGSLKATKSLIDAFVGFDITYSDAKTVSYATLPLPKISGKGHRLEYRHVYKNYNVKQELKYDRRASQVYGTSHIYPKKWVERQYRVVEFYR